MTFFLFISATAASKLFIKKPYLSFRETGLSMIRP